MRRRDVLRSALIGATALAAPNIVAAETQRVLKFLPQADLATLDPVWTTVTVSRNHGFLVFDTLYGYRRALSAPAADGHGRRVENDDRLWGLRLRDGLHFDGRRCWRATAWPASSGGRSATSWARRCWPPPTSFRRRTIRTIRFRLRRGSRCCRTRSPSPSCLMCAIMPERLAQTDPFKPVTEVVGSGPYRFVDKGTHQRRAGGLREERRLRAGHRASRASPPAPSCRCWTASCGTSSPTSPPPPPSSPAKRTGGSSRPSTRCRCWRKPASWCRWTTRPATIGLPALQPPVSAVQQRRHPPCRAGRDRSADVRRQAVAGADPELIKTSHRSVRARHGVGEVTYRRAR